MKYLLPLIILIISCISLQNRKTTISEVVETACGLCFFDMTTDECRIAVKINDKSYFVENTSIKEYCDPNEKESLCSGIKSANVIGKIKHGVFIDEKFEIIKNKELK